MSRVIMMCGPAGAGKSTIARRLQAAGAVRLSLDEEAWERGEHADDFVLTEDLAAEYFDHFEVPTPEEGPLTIIG